ncbi:hypothetical protein FSP39_006875 [Pinctada imbricata]|uniref:Uncharacterized protein n=1 Tax=Pinctada imbricata TaxID=66713 RepID=A0AA89BKC2_PINIB|nr:hypothetical protein FSP39_006875 [Pinctada imbricata]
MLNCLFFNLKLNLFHFSVYESTNYWVTKTDYDIYAVVYGCRNRTQTVCLEADSWIFGRHQNHFTTQQMETIDTEIERLCLNTSDFLQTNQTMGM